MIASMSKSFDMRLLSKFKKEHSPRFFISDFSDKVQPDTNYLQIRFFSPEPHREGWINVERTPDNNSLLTVMAYDKFWPELEPIWKLLYDELERLGYLLKENQIQIKGLEEYKEINEEYLVLFDQESMRKYYQYYSVDTAEEIIRNLKKAWSERRRWSGRWGPGIISKYSTRNRDTISRYLGAFKKAGIDNIKGIPIPHTFKSRQ